MPATRKNLPDGITLIDVNGNKYTVVGDPIGFGGSSIIYRVRKNNDTEGQTMEENKKAIVKEVITSARNKCSHFAEQKKEVGAHE